MNFTLPDFIQGDVLIAIICVLLALALVLFLKERVGRQPYPPGPYGLPVVGYLPFLKKYLHLQFHEFSKKYGDIFSIKIGSLDVVILNSAKVIKDVVSKPEFLGRPEENPINMVAKTPFFSNGQLWQDHRRYVLHALRDLGLGKSKMHQLVKEEINYILSTLEKIDQPCDVKSLLTPSMSNNICSLILGKRYDYNEPERRFLDNILNKVQEFLNPSAPILFFPRLFKFRFFRKLLDFERLVEFINEFRSFIKDKIEDRKKNLDKDNPRDLIESYLCEVEARKSVDPNSTLKEYYLPGVLQNLFGAGSETVRTSVGWALYTMAAYPEIQKKVQIELDTVIGTERTPNFEDYKDVPYTQAVLAELMRWRTIAPLGIFRKVLKSTETYGYYFPEGTIVMPNLWAAHHDPRCWENPEEFLPQRFLSTDGKTFIKSENLIPFSFGKRNCPGEGLAVTEVFLYFTSIMQRFFVSLPPGVVPDFDGDISITLKPKPHKLFFKLRL